MGLMRRQTRYSPEGRERAVRMVREQSPEHPSQWTAMEAIAPKLGCSPETLRRWARQAERDAGPRAGLTTTEQQRLKEVERENRELKRANEILRKASAYFAHAELDRRAKPRGARGPGVPIQTGAARSGATPRDSSRLRVARLGVAAHRLRPGRAGTSPL